FIFIYSYLHPQGAPADVSDPDPLSFAEPQSRPAADIAQFSKGAAAAGDSESENTSFASMVGSPKNQETAAPEVPPPENVITIEDVPEAGTAERVAAADPPAAKEHRKRGHDGVDMNAHPKVLRRDHADPRPIGSTRGGKSLAAIELGMGSTGPTHAPQGAPADVSDPDPLSFAEPQSRPAADIAQ
nr:hypothetical protein [Tanacetum cinerariifolium]